MARLFDVEQRKVTEILGIEAGYQYVDSPIVWPELGERPDPDASDLCPDHAGPERGCRTSGWTTAARCTTTLAMGSRCCASAASRCDTSSLESAIRATGAPLKILDIPDNRPREIYGHDIVLIRPDLHVAWRADAPPADADSRVALRHRLD